MNRGDQLARDVLRMTECKTWQELESVCRDLDARYDVEGADDDLRRTYELLRTVHAKRVAGTLAA